MRAAAFSSERAIGDLGLEIQAAIGARWCRRLVENRHAGTALEKGGGKSAAKLTEPTGHDRGAPVK